MRAGLLIAMLVALGGCGDYSSGIGSLFGGSRTEDAGLPYRTSHSVGEDKLDITITAEAPAATLEDVRESVRFEATQYCLYANGGSDADWAIDPATGDWAMTQVGETLVFQARCRR